MKLMYKLENQEELVKNAKRKAKESLSLSFDEAIALFYHYAEKAVDFFCIDPNWEIVLSTDFSEDGACINFTSRYLYAEVSFNPEYYRVRPNEIRRAAVHEIAHVFLGKIHGFLQILPQEYSDETHPFNKYYEDAFEECTTRLERLFFKYRGKKNEREDN